MKVLVYGGRNYQDYRTLSKILSKLHRQHHFTHLIHGAARGADSLADRWARENNIPVTRYPAKWNTHQEDCRDHCRRRSYCARAGILRNEAMARKGRPDMAVGFPGGNGTKHMTQTATAEGIRTIVVDPR